MKAMASKDQGMPGYQMDSEPYCIFTRRIRKSCCTLNICSLLLNLSGLGYVPGVLVRAARWSIERACGLLF